MNDDGRMIRFFPRFLAEQLLRREFRWIIV